MAEKKATKAQKEFLANAFEEYLAYLDNGQGITYETSEDIRKHGLFIIDNMPYEYAKAIKESHDKSKGVYLSNNIGNMPIGKDIRAKGYHSPFKSFDGEIEPNKKHAGATIHAVLVFAREFYTIFHNAKYGKDNNVPIKCYADTVSGALIVDLEAAEPDVLLESAFYVLWEEYGNKDGKETPKEYSNISNTVMGGLVKKMLNAPTKLESYRKPALTQDYDDLLETMTITYKGSNKNSETYVFTIENFKTLFSRQVRNGAKVFTYCLKIQNEQHRLELTFSLSDFVGENAPYSSLDTAYRGLKNIFSKLQKIVITGESYVRGKPKRIISSPVVAIYDISYTTCRVTLHPYFANSPYFTLLPNWAFALQDKDFMFVDYIYSLARQHTKDIKESGGFNISLEAIRIYLGLPSAKDTQKHTEKIINPIDDAIEKIEDIQRATGKTDLIIKPMNISYKNITEYLNGYLRIELNKEATEHFTSIKKK